MGAALIKAPANLSLSKNISEIQIQSDNYNNGAGIKAINHLLFQSVINAGDKIKLTWASNAIEFTASNAPDNSGLQFPAGAVSANYVTSLLDWIGANYRIQQDFIVTKSNYLGTYHSLMFTAGETGTRFNMITLGFVANMSVVRPVSGTDEVIKPNFAHLVQVVLAGTDTRIYNETIDLDYPITGVTTKDIAGILHPYLDYDLPQLNTVWQLCTLSVLQYYLVYGQYFGTVPDFQRTFKSPVYTIALGGYSNKALSRITTADHFENYLLPHPSLYNYQRWFETFPVDAFEVTTNQPQFLYFMNMRDVAETLDLRVTITYSDATIQRIVIPGGLVQPKQKVCVGCGYQQLGLQAYNTTAKMVTGYTVGIVQHTTNDPRSLLKSFSVYRDYEEYTRFILYSDSAGNFKTLRTTGRNSPVAEINSSLAERFDSLNTPKVGNFSRYDIKLTESDELNTGYLVGDQELDDLQELLLSRYAFRVIGGTFLPIVMTGKKMSLEADGQNLKALKIEYRLAYDEEVYTGSTGQLIVPRFNDSQQAFNEI
jgi:hypothetical protein